MASMDTKFKEYWLSIPTQHRQAFADDAETTVGYLNMYAHGQKKRLGAEIAVGVEIASKGAIPLSHLRPELAQKLERAGYRKRKANQ